MTRGLETLDTLERDARNAFEEYKEQIESGEMDSYEAAHDAFGDGIIYTADQINVAKDYHFSSATRASIAHGCEELTDIASEGAEDWGDYTGRVANAIGCTIYENVFRELADELDD